MPISPTNSQTESVPVFIFAFKLPSNVYVQSWCVKSRGLVSLTWSGHKVTLMSPLMPSGWNIDWMAPVVKDSMAFLFLLRNPHKHIKTNEQTQTCTQTLTAVSGLFFITRLYEINGARSPTDLKHTVVVHVHQWEGETLGQHPVKPPLHDCRNTEPVQRELEKQRHTHTHFSSVRASFLLLTAASCLWPLTWKIISSAASTLRCSATMSSLRRPSSQACMVSSPYWNSWVFLHSP